MGANICFIIFKAVKIQFLEISISQKKSLKKLQKMLFLPQNIRAFAKFDRHKTHKCRKKIWQRMDI